MAVRQPLDAIAAAPRARAGLVLVCCLIRCCPMGSRWSPSGRAARWGHDRQRSRRARWATTSRAFAGRRRWTRLVGAHIDSATPRLDSDSQAAVDVFYCDVVSVNAVLAELRSPCSKNEKKPPRMTWAIPCHKNTAREPHGTQLRLLRQRYICSDTWRARERAVRAEGTCSLSLKHIWPLCASALARTLAVAARRPRAEGRRLTPRFCAADGLSFCAAPVETLPLDAAALTKTPSRSRHASVDAGSMPRGKRAGSTRPPGMLSPEQKTKIDKSIVSQREALLAVHGKATELLPREHADFFTRMDATNVDDVPLAGLSQEDLAVICKGDGGRGTNRNTVKQYLRDRLARAAQPDAAGALTAKRAKLREDGKLDLEFTDLDDDARKNAWRALLIDSASPKLNIGKTLFLARTGGIGSSFYDQLAWERRDAAFVKAKASGALWTSDRERTYTAS